jgi:hypothetical protein
MIEDKWGNTDACDVCGELPSKGNYWMEEHFSMGISGFTFVFCDSCSKDKQEECDRMIKDCLLNWKKHCEEQWAKNKELT